MRSLLAFDTQVVEISGVPQRIEVPFQRRLVVNVTGAGEHAGLDGVSRDPPVAMDNNFDYHIVLLCRAGAREKKKRQDKANHRYGTTAGPANQ